MFPKAFRPLPDVERAQSVEIRRTVRETQSLSRQLAERSYRLRRSATETCDRSKRLIEECESMRAPAKAPTA